MLKSINPKTGKAIKAYKTLSKAKIEKRINKAAQAQQIWKNTDLVERARLMFRAADVLEERKDKFARLMTNEMGKPLAESKSEIDKCVWVCRFYAEKAKTFLRNQIIKTEATKSYIAYKPMGVVLAVMPWNYPFWQVFRFAAPALMAGNAGLLKHAGNVTGCAFAIEKVFQEAGFPKGLFRTLPIESKQVKSILKNPTVCAVTLTGSEGAGRAVAKTAGSQLKKSVLELGGSDAYIVLEDADLAKASKMIAQSRLLNNGQSCISAKRMIVVEKVYDKFLKLFKAEMEAKKMGDPLVDENCLGPMARPDLRDELHEQVKKSIKKGAECILGGKIPKRKGAYYPATILTNIPKKSPAYKEEFFGPVAIVFKVKDELEAIKIANDTSFGLGSGVFTKNIKRGEDIARNYLDAGASFVNSFVKSDPRLPFGGIKNSGYGRELSHLGIREFTNIKTIYIA